MNKFILILACVGLSACSSHNVKQPTLSGLALQQLQTREYETKYETAFKSVMSVLQDAGYILENADMSTGFITGKSPSSSKTTYNLFTGLGKTNGTTKVSSTVEKVGESFTKVRLNFVAIDENSNLYGNARTDTPVEDEKLYENVFEKISETIFIKQATQ